MWNTSGILHGDGFLVATKYTYSTVSRLNVKNIGHSSCFYCETLASNGEARGEPNDAEFFIHVTAMPWIRP
jgi:hypothetical protein